MACESSPAGPRKPQQTGDYPGTWAVQAARTILEASSPPGQAWSHRMTTSCTSRLCRPPFGDPESNPEAVPSRVLLFREGQTWRGIQGSCPHHWEPMMYTGSCMALTPLGFLGPEEVLAVNWQASEAVLEPAYLERQAV